MNIIKIPKGHGKFRTICIPTPEEKAKNALWIPRFQKELEDQWGDQIKNRTQWPIHGFTPGRSPATNALAHRGHRFSLCFDLKDFFDTVRVRHVIGYVPPHQGMPMVQDCFFIVDKDQMRCGSLIERETEWVEWGKQNGMEIIDLTQIRTVFTSQASPTQGLPASPVIANLAAFKMDLDILALNKTGRLGTAFVYTRYCDDLTFSFDTEGVGKMLEIEIPKIVEKHRFVINPDKTHWQCSDAGRRIITGVSVGNDIRMTRKTRRRIRAARHQIRNKITGRNRARLAAIARQRRIQGDPVSLHGLLVSGYRGLKEWSTLRLPKEWIKDKAANETKPVMATRTQQRASNNQQSAVISVPENYNRKIG